MQICPASRKAKRKPRAITSRSASGRSRSWPERFGIGIGCESRAGHAAKVMVTFARDGGYDLVVVGHSDHSEFWGRLLGDTADRISDHAHCSVLIVKQPET